jgi:lipopolysaccharide export system permease protein
MSILDRYIARNFLSTFLILLSIIIGMVIMLDLLLNQDEFSKDPNAGSLQVLKYMLSYYGYNLPTYFSLLAGPIMTISAAFALGLMLRNNEMTPLAAAGVRLQRLIAPLLLCSLAIVVVWIANREIIIPSFALKIARERDDYLGARTTGVHCVRDARNSILTAGQLYPRQGKLDRVYIIEPDQHGRPANIIHADSAIWTPTDEDEYSWRLENGARISIDEDTSVAGLTDDIRRARVDTYHFGLKPRDLLLRQSAQFAELMSFEQMNSLVQSQNLPNRDSVRRARDVRFTQPFLQIIMLLLVTPFFLRRAPMNVLGASGWALLTGALFFLVTFLSQSFGGEGTLAQLAVGFPLVLFGPIAVLRLANVKT